MTPRGARIRVAEWCRLPRIGAELWLAEFGLGTVGVRRMTNWMSAPLHSVGGPGEDPSIEVARARRIAWLVQGVARRLPGKPRCLAQSLVLRRALAREGLAGRLIIGVQRRSGNLDAHAWVEYRGEALQPESPSHRPIAAL